MKKQILLTAIIFIVLIGSLLLFYFFNEEQDSFKIIKRFPEGTEKGFIQENKIIKNSLDKVSIIFNNRIDKNTLTKENFYVLRGIEDKIPGEIEYKEGERTAFFIFNQEVKGGKIGQEKRITVVVKNIESLKGDKIEPLIYNIDIIENK